MKVIVSMLMEIASFNLVCGLLWPLQDGKQTQGLLIPPSCASQSLCFRARSKDVPRKWTISNYDNDPCLTESPFVAIAQVIIATHALNYYDKFF